jgi:mRNA interferase MazF
VEKPVKGDVVVVPFPFSDLTQSKRRPALVLASLPGEDLILCQITSRAVTDANAVSLEEGDFVSGGLSVSSNIRPNRLFTAGRRIVFDTAGKLRSAVLGKAILEVISILRS